MYVRPSQQYFKSKNGIYGVEWIIWG